MLSNGLAEYNPWWKGEYEMGDDPEIRKWDASLLKWVPRLMRTFEHGDLFYSLRGPRQVGKTTLVKLMIRDLLDGGISGWNIMYYSFELKDHPRDVVNMVDEYLDNTKQFRQDLRSYIFLDEISSVHNWQKGIKKLWDMGKLKNCTVIATGSHWIDLRRAAEKLPGRRGRTADTYDKIMPPMKFAEYVESVDGDLKNEIRSRNLLCAQNRHEILGKLSAGEMPDEFAALAVYHKALENHLSNYLVTGGIASSTNEFLEDGHVAADTYKVYLDAMAGDLDTTGRGESYLLQLVPNIMQSMGNPVSWNALRQNSGIGSHHTVEQYVQTLSDLFVLYFCYGYDASKSRASLGKDKKIYFRDPFFFHALHGKIEQEDPFELSKRHLSDPGNFSRLLECVVGDHVIRLGFHLADSKLAYDYHNSVFYWRGKNGREVDFVVRGSRNTIPIELKYQESIKPEDTYGLIDFKKASNAGNSLLLTKNRLEVSPGSARVPASMFLLLV